MIPRFVLGLPLLAAATGWAQCPVPVSAEPKPDMPAVCLTCHKPKPNNLRGYLDSTAWKTSALQVNLGTATEILRFDPKVVKVEDGGAAKPVEFLKTAKKGRDIRIEFTECDGVRTATLVSFKGPIPTPPEKLVTFEQIDKLVAKGAGDVVLVDSRPAPKFHEGSIPGAINVPFPAWDKQVGKLPAQKDKLLVFFCQGPTCMMSPNSLAKAEKLGYTNAKVYREGWPEWTQKRAGAIAPMSFKEAFLDKGIPYVMVDARPAGIAPKTGFLPGAVAIPPGALDEAIKGFPDKSLKAPILVYDAGGGEAAATAARIVAAGYENVLVVQGGLTAWLAAGQPLETGQPATKVAYVPKARPGSIPVADFERIAATKPSDTVILDVRTRDEAKFGVIPGALNIPEEELLANLDKLPQGKLLVTHCSTGVRAEMAYHKLKAKGYNVAFLLAEVDVGKDGKFEVSVN